MPQYYPVMLNVRNRPAIIVGGDRIAAEKAKALWESGANVQVLSPTFCDELLLLAEQERFTLHRKAYEPGDLAGAFVVVAATTDPQLVQAIWT
ncbi:MAG: bifunctional precorrin-2 dehydrogenase/sirohydrochlorin ferrochelatase, partial [Ktedonobacteraceae bacterium]